MLISFIIFFLSVVGLGALVVLRTHMEHVREYRFVYPVVVKARKTNVYLHEFITNARSMMRYANKKTMVLLVHFIIEEIEHLFQRFMRFVKGKLPPVKK